MVYQVEVYGQSLWAFHTSKPYLAQLKLILPYQSGQDAHRLRALCVENHKLDGRTFAPLTIACPDELGVVGPAHLEVMSRDELDDLFLALPPTSHFDVQP